MRALPLAGRGRSSPPAAAPAAPAASIPAPTTPATTAPAPTTPATTAPATTAPASLIGALEGAWEYSQIAPATYARWRNTTPPAFRFAVKRHRFVTHYKRLRDCRDSIVRLCDQARHLGPKLAAVLWQLPRT
jgi:hypothetical protein